jgi:RNA polymerase sigma-54 factor
MNLVQSQGQSLILTPQLQTSLAILKASAQDIEGVLAQIAEGNPCFEIDEEFGSELGDFAKDDGAEPPLDVLISERFTEPELPQEIRDKVFANISSRAETLEDYLTRELTAAGFSLDILPFIDERGYFTGSLSDNFDLTDALVFIRNLEPKGLGAYDSKHCLLMQLGDDSLARRILMHHEERFIKRRIPLIAALCGVTPQEVEDVYTQLAKLNPIPASEFAQPEPYAKLPEVFLDKEGNITGDFKRTPKYKVSQHWLQKLASSDEEAKAYLRDKIKDAKYYLKAIALRNTTVVEVFRCIYKVQHRFFTHNEALLPLSMHQIAEELELHETTISRAVSGKYVSTPKGVFELKRFFSLALIDSQGNMISNNVAKQAVLDCIQGEDKQRPFSDEEIMHRLKLKDIDIARRTIAKYRNLAGILNSNLRIQHAKPN